MLGYLLMVLTIALIPFFADACTAAAPCTASDRIITFYVPHNSPGCRTSMEGCVETSRPGLDGQRVPRSLDDVRAGRAKFVTLASDSSNYGKYFNIGTITYLSAEDKQKHTVQNVIGYVHDTGGAFKGKPQKLDVNTTICKNCTDAQASAMAAGKNVSFTPSTQGLVDPVSGNNGYGNVLTGNAKDGAGTAPTGVSSGAPSGGAPSGSAPGPIAGPGGSGSDPKTEPTGIDSGKNPKVPPDIPTDPIDPGDENKNITITCTRASIAWTCPTGATKARGKSKPYDRKFATKGATEGIREVKPRFKTTYTIECFTGKKIIATSSCVVPRANIQSTLKPVLTLEIEDERVRRGQHTHVTWSALRVKSCIITGQGINEKGPVGSIDTDALLRRGTNEIVLRCIDLEGKPVEKTGTVVIE
ncbi:MAG: hypothetical protein RI911_615 [Candidatus Parcubacteria bacterium]|jgi:hypothetical protein